MAKQPQASEPRKHISQPVYLQVYNQTLLVFNELSGLREREQNPLGKAILAAAISLVGMYYYLLAATHARHDTDHPDNGERETEYVKLAMEMWESGQEMITKVATYHLDKFTMNRDFGPGEMLVSPENADAATENRGAT